MRYLLYNNRCLYAFIKVSILMSLFLYGLLFLLVKIVLHLFSRLTYILEILLLSGYFILFVFIQYTIFLQRLLFLYLLWDKRRGRDGTGGEAEDAGEEEGERREEGGNEDRDLMVILYLYFVYFYVTAFWNFTSFFSSLRGYFYFLFIYYFVLFIGLFFMYLYGCFSKFYAIILRYLICIFLLNSDRLFFFI